MNFQLPKLAPVLLAGILVSAGMIFRGPPLDPDVLMGKEQIAGAFLIFLGWAVCTFSWGLFLTRTSGMDRIGLGALAPAAVLGPVFLSMVVYALGVLGLIGYALSPLHLAILFVGPVLLARSTSTAPREASEPWRWPEYILLGTIAYSLLGRIIRASLANGTTDPAMYHLLGPRLWSEAGAIELWPRWPVVANASYWEQLFVLGNSMLGGKEGQGLIEGQFFGQWTHVFFGLGGTLAVAFALQRLLGISRAWALLGCLAVTISKAQIGYSVIAKNDYGIESWVLFSIALLLAPKARRTSFQIFAGVLTGMALMGKVISVISIAPWAALWVSSEFRGRKTHDFVRTVSVVACGVVLGMLPILARNFWFTRNPFFPMFPSLFPNEDWLTAPQVAFIDHALGFPLRTFQNFAAELKLAAWDTPLLGLSLLLIPFALMGLTDWPQALLVIGATLGVLSYCSVDLPNPFLRWVAPSLGVLQFSATAPLEAIARRFGKSPAMLALLALLPAAFYLLRVESPSRAWSSLIDGESPTLIFRLSKVNNGGDSKAWLRLNAKQGETIASLGDTAFYHMYYLTPFAVQQHPVLEPRTRECMNAVCVVNVLRSYHVKYLYDVFHWSQRYYSPLAAMMDEAASEVPGSIVYAGRDSQVLDVVALQEGLLDGCAVDHPAPDDFLVP